MKLCVVNFSVSNGGNFLIEKRMNSLIKRTWPEARIDYVNGIDNTYDYSNQYDAVIGGGGSYYDDRIIESIFVPFFGETIKGIKFHLIGSGVYWEDYLDNAIYSKTFSPTMMRFFESIEVNGGTLSCRDQLSWQILNNNGIKELYMTECPAWYNFNYIDITEPRFIGKFNKIIMSDPDITKATEEQDVRATQAIEVIKTVKEMFPEARLVFTFNNGINTKYSSICNNRIKDYLENQGIDYIDLSRDEKKFTAYDDADLHIGFRVYSHIYSLSRRITSVLIEEDLRGGGNE